MEGVFLKQVSNPSCVLPTFKFRSFVRCSFVRPSHKVRAYALLSTRSWNQILIEPSIQFHNGGPYLLRFLCRVWAGLRENAESQSGWAGEAELGHVGAGVGEHRLGSDAVERVSTLRGREVASLPASAARRLDSQAQARKACRWASNAREVERRGRAASAGALEQGAPQ